MTLAIAPGGPLAGHSRAAPSSSPTPIALNVLGPTSTATSSPTPRTTSTPTPLPPTPTSTSSPTLPPTPTWKRDPPPDPGSGHLHLRLSTRAHFPTLRATYPLKLLAPAPLPSQPPNVAAVYTLNHGGGLVAGDRVQLSVAVDEGCTLAMLTQGSTKVFRHRGQRPLAQGVRRGERPLGGGSGGGADGASRSQNGDVQLRGHGRVPTIPTIPASSASSTTIPTTIRTTIPTAIPSSAPNPLPTTIPNRASALGAPGASEQAPSRQRLHITLAPHATLLLLPDSLSPFRASRYAQAQRVVMAPGASVLLLDWVNSGRGARPPVGRHAGWYLGRKGGRVLGRGGGGSGSVGGEGEVGKFGEEKIGKEVAEGKTGTRDGPSDGDIGDDEVWAMAYYSSTNELVAAPDTTTASSPATTAPASATTTPTSTNTATGPPPSPASAPPRPRVLARERMVLDNLGAPLHAGAPLSPVARRLAPYHVYASVLVFGPALAPLRACLDRMVDGSAQFQVPKPPGLLWSWSVLEGKSGSGGGGGGGARSGGGEVEGGILRVAGVEVEDVRDWLRGVFERGGVKDLVGEGLWPRCI